MAKQNTHMLLDNDFLQDVDRDSPLDPLMEDMSVNSDEEPDQEASRSIDSETQQNTGEALPAAERFIRLTQKTDSQHSISDEVRRGFGGKRNKGFLDNVA